MVRPTTTLRRHWFVSRLVKDICNFTHFHAVFKALSTTTKVRIVFDASCRTANGKSLNDNLLVGAKQQNDLFDILIKFRKYQVGFTGDIEKMYRQIMVHSKDQCLQKILWREKDNAALQEYQLTTVTYGTAAAPFLATRTLQEIANRIKDSYPETSKMIKQQFYMDDLMGCAADVDQAIKLRQEVSDQLIDAGFHLRKWSSNSLPFLESVSVEDREIVTESEINQVSTVNILGLRWNTAEDNFKYSITLPIIGHIVTKRTVLSEISKIYDPIGWLAPVVIRYKIFMQKLWLKGVSWDEPLSDDLRHQWLMYRETIDAIKDLKIPRWVQYIDDDQIQLHGFADASEVAYAATVYLRVQNNDGVKVHLIAAKTRVTPVKQISLPRLELCAAQLLVKLMTRVKLALDMPQAEMFGWSDSTVVLSWLSDFPRRWKSFVANRTSYIIDILPSQHWRHIKSLENPADIATRGIESSNLLNNNLWWHGPNILKATIIEKTSLQKITEGTDLEERKEKLVNTVNQDEQHFMYKFSDMSHLTRVCAWLIRFGKNCLTEKTKRQMSKVLIVDELKISLQTLIICAQSETYKKEIIMLKKEKQLPIGHKLAALTPFVDKQGLLRVGGRIENANISFEHKHPVILNKNHHLTIIMIRQYHVQYLHAGNRLLQCILGLKYWISEISQATKRCVYQCPTCIRQKAQPFKQQMGNLPGYRFKVGSAFTNVGIDYAGPLQLRAWKGRGNKTIKAWIAIFVCLVTKAIHIEVVTDLSTAAFIASFRRFVSRRGRPTHVFSDNGTNFVGADRYLRELYQFLENHTTQDALSNELTNQNIQWHFSPPSSPHFGGIWEAGVKSMKYHLKRVLNESLLTYEELSTVLCQIEACLNSRPLCLKFAEDMEPLTPAHFLILRPMSSVVEEDALQGKENRINRWKYIQRLVQSFWKRWSIEYIHQLQQKTKWTQKIDNVSLGTIVLIKDENLPPSQWRLGKIIQLHTGSDGLVRVVTLNTARGQITRPIVKLCPLLVDVEDVHLQRGPECLATPSQNKQ